MPVSRPLSLVPVQFDIVARGEAIASAYRLGNGCWQFHDLKYNWWEESLGPLEVEQLLDAYKEIRKRRGQITRARLSRKGK